MLSLVYVLRVMRRKLSLTVSDPRNTTDALVISFSVTYCESISLYNILFIFLINIFVHLLLLFWCTHEISLVKGKHFCSEQIFSLTIHGKIYILINKLFIFVISFSILFCYLASGLFDKNVIFYRSIISLHAFYNL